MDDVYIYDTTLRDGEQAPGINLSGREKLQIALQLEKLGVADAAGLFANPERYRGLAAEKAARLAAKYSQLMEGK